MPSLFNSAREVLEDLNSMKDSPDTAADAIDVDSQLFPKLEQASQIARSELNRE